MTSSRPRIGVISPSSPVGLVELDRGIARLRAAGFDVVEHPNARARHFVNAGTDDQRAMSLIDFAFDASIDVIWCARGGYGAARVANILEANKSRGVPPRKTLVGYSDVTFLHEYVRREWDWRTIHAPMVASTGTTKPEEWAAVDAMVRGEATTLPYASPCLRWLANPPKADLVGDVVGGNLAIWTSLAGTRWQPAPAGTILFLEDISEAFYRIDRMVVQLEQSGMLDGLAAIVLGDFADCADESTTMLAPDGQTRVPLRPTVSNDDGLLEMFGRVATKFGIPLAAGLPVGHGPNYWPLELGVSHRLTADGRLLR